MQNALETQVNRLRSQIEDGMNLHIEMTKIRNEAATGVVAASDLLGRNWGANMMLVVAAVSVRNAADLLNRYIDKTTSGAARSVRVLKVARTAGKVAEVGLAIASGAALVTGVGAASGVAATDAVVDAAAEKELAKYVARHPELASELNSVKLVPGPRGTVLGGMRAGQSSGAGTGFHKW